ncbi:hypothetical protein LUX33_42755 [Actinomadura madurae]|uniref:helix-turn-helix domain-containing protein n=1 Tax=Actinomadura madurae TaxID=1993 RepID=UPI0020D235A5|nr:hypothetical protein [Actinomadura madurae]MCP9954460.1 hypothetical protein [Actinomadura madurae]
MEFAGALRQAVQASGLTLDRIRHRLGRQGLTVSVATLSYWQRGRSRPRSRTVVVALEEILQVPPGSLTELLDDPAAEAVAVRGARPGPAPGRAATGERGRTVRDLWSDPERYARPRRPARPVGRPPARTAQHPRRLPAGRGPPLLDAVGAHRPARRGRRRRPRRLRPPDGRPLPRGGRAGRRGGPPRRPAVLPGPAGSAPKAGWWRSSWSSTGCCRRATPRSSSTSSGGSRSPRATATTGGSPIPSTTTWRSSSSPGDRLPARCYGFTAETSAAPRRRLGELWIGTSGSANIAVGAVRRGIVGIEWEWH